MNTSKSFLRWGRAGLFSALSLAVAPGHDVAAAVKTMEAVSDYAAVNSGGKVQIFVLRNDWLPTRASRDLRVTIVRAPDNGVVKVGRWNQLVYRAGAGASGEDRLVYRVEHAPSGRSDTAEVTIFIRSGASRALEAVPDVVTVQPGKGVRIHALGNDILPSRRVEMQLVQGPSLGRVKIKRFKKWPMFEYRAARGRVGEDRFVYEVRDRSGNTSRAVVSVYVGMPEGGRPGNLGADASSGDGEAPGNGGAGGPAPKPGGNALAARPDEAVVPAGTRAVIDVLGNDTAEGLVRLRIVSQPSVGRAWLQSRRRIAYKAPTGFQGRTQLVYEISDDRGNRSAATVRVDIPCNTCQKEPKVILSWQPPDSTVDAYHVFFDRTPNTHRLLREVSVIKGDVDAARPSVQFKAKADLGAVSGDTICFRVRSVANGAVSALSEPICKVL